MTINRNVCVSRGTMGGANGTGLFSDLIIIIFIYCYFIILSYTIINIDWQYTLQTIKLIYYYCVYSQYDIVSNRRINYSDIINYYNW